MFNNQQFKTALLQGIPEALPGPPVYDTTVSHAPVRKMILNEAEKKLAIKNALRYFPVKWHEILAPEFKEELETFGRIYMYRFRPDYKMQARPIDAYPAQCTQAAAIMLMIQNNLDPAVAQHPHELITYGGNGAVFQNWAQYLITMQYLTRVTTEQTLHLYSGHPMGLFPSSPAAPRVVITNGMMIPNYSKQDDWERYNALGVTQYGQMTAGSFMYIGPQGIVHGTTITLMNAFRKTLPAGDTPAGKLFLTSGLGGMSGAQPKAGKIVGCVTVCAEVNKAAAEKRWQQGWVDELMEDPEQLCARVQQAMKQKEAVSIAYVGNIVHVWEKFHTAGIFVTIGSDQTSLHNPWSGGYYPCTISFEEASAMIATAPQLFKEHVQQSLQLHATFINLHTANGTYFFDYGNAFMLECSRCGAPVMNETGSGFRYPSYVQDILGPMCFDLGFGPFRWVCTSGNPADLAITDAIAHETLLQLLSTTPAYAQQQLQDNINWIAAAQKNQLVVGSQARILYADAIGRITIALNINQAISEGRISAPVVLGRDHHDVSGTDSPYRETSNIYDGSSFTADMAVHNVIGDSFRGASWVSIHNGGGVGWGEVINGGFGLVLDGSEEADKKLKDMLFFDVNNGIARRSWAGNSGALQALDTEMQRNNQLTVTVPNIASDDLINQLF